MQAIKYFDSIKKIVNKEKNLLKLKSNSIVAFVWRFNTQTADFSSQPDTLTLLNLPDCEPEIEISRWCYQHVFRKFLFQLEMIHPLNYTKTTTIIINEALQNKAVDRIWRPKYAASFNWIFHISTQFRCHKLIHTISMSSSSRPIGNVDIFFAIISLTSWKMWIISVCVQQQKTNYC